MTNFIAVGYVALGGAVGSALRFLISSYMGRHLSHTFPYGTITVNIIGSMLMGILIGYMAKHLPGESMLRTFLAVGVLGGFTTFSAFSLDAITLIERGEITTAILYVVGSVGFSILGLFAGLFIMRAFA